MSAIVQKGPFYLFKGIKLVENEDPDQAPLQSDEILYVPRLGDAYASFIHRSGTSIGRRARVNAARKFRQCARECWTFQEEYRRTCRRS